MKLGMPTLIEFQSIDNNIRLCEELELDFIELNMNLPPFSPESFHHQDIIRLRKQHNIDFTIHLPEELDLSSFHPSIRRGHLQRCKETIEWASSAEIKTINMHLNNGIYFTLPEGKLWINERYKEQFIELLSESYNELYDLTKKYGVDLCIENTCNFHIPFVQEALNKLNELHSNSYLTWDVGHDAKAQFKEESTFIRYFDRIRHMHLHDFNGVSDHQPLYSGQVPINERLKFAQEHNLSVVVEVKTSISLRDSIDRLRALF